MRSRLLLAVLFGFAPSPAFAAKVAVLLSKDLPAYSQAVSGFQKGFAGDTTLFNMRGSKVRGFDLAKEIKAGKFDAVVAFGAKAAGVAKSELSMLPLAFGMVVRPEAHGLVGEKNIAGVTFMVPILRQLETAKKVVPHAKRIGVLVQPNSKTWLKKARAAAAKTGLELVPVEVGSKHDIPGALDKLGESDIDIFWMIPERVLLSKLVLKKLIAFTLGKQIPFLAPSDSFVKAGALFSVTADYAGQGRQVSAIISKVLGGASPGAIGVVDPHGAQTALNLKTAAAIDLVLSPAVRKTAARVFGNGTPN